MIFFTFILKKFKTSKFNYFDFFSNFFKRKAMSFNWPIRTEFFNQSAVAIGGIAAEE